MCLRRSRSAYQRQLKANESTKGIPIQVLTGSKLAIQLVEGYKLGVHSYVVKPTNATEFVKTVSAIGSYCLNVNEPLPC